MLFISNLLQLLKKPIKLEAFYDVAGLSVLNPPMFYQVSTIKYLICLQHEMDQVSTINYLICLQHEMGAQSTKCIRFHNPKHLIYVK